MDGLLFSIKPKQPRHRPYIKILLNIRAAYVFVAMMKVFVFIQ